MSNLHQKFDKMSGRALKKMGFLVVAVVSPEFELVSRRLKSRCWQAVNLCLQWFTQFLFVTGLNRNCTLCSKFDVELGLLTGFYCS